MTVACLIVAFALGVGIGGIVLAAGVALYVLGTSDRCLDRDPEIVLRDTNGDEIKAWRAK